MLRSNTFFYCAITIYIPFKYFSNQIEFDLKSINQEFLLFLKLLKTHPLQYSGSPEQGCRGDFCPPPNFSDNVPEDFFEEPFKCAFFENIKSEIVNIQ